MLADLNKRLPVPPRHPGREGVKVVKPSSRPGAYFDWKVFRYTIFLLVVVCFFVFAFLHEIDVL